MHLAILNYCMPLVVRLFGSLVCWLAVFDSTIGAHWAHWGDPNSTREIDGMPAQQVICTMLHTQSQGKNTSRIQWADYCRQWNYNR
jgi:hypothetical protein